MILSKAAFTAMMLENNTLYIKRAHLYDYRFYSSMVGRLLNSGFLSHNTSSQTLSVLRDFSIKFTDAPAFAWAEDNAIPSTPVYAAMRRQHATRRDSRKANSQYYDNTAVYPRNRSFAALDYWLAKIENSAGIHFTSEEYFDF